MELKQCHAIISNNIVNAYALVDDNGFGYKVYYKEYSNIKQIDFEYIKSYGSRIHEYDLIKTFFNIPESEFLIH